MRFLAIFCFVLLSGIIQAQFVESFDIKPRYTIKTNPLAMIVGTTLYSSEYRIVLENTTEKNQSIQIGASYLSTNSILKSEAKADTNFKNGETIILRGFRVQASYRFYLADAAPNGFYVAPHVSYSIANLMLKFNNTVYHNTYYRLTYLNYSGMIGYQGILNRTLVFDVFLGLGYRDNKFEYIKNGTFTLLDAKGLYFFPENIKVYLGFNVGYAF